MGRRIATVEILDVDANGNSYVKYAVGETIPDTDKDVDDSDVEDDPPDPEPVSGIQVDEETGLIKGDTADNREAPKAQSKRRTPGQHKAKPQPEE
jgi:hypothetical protein